MAHAFNQTMAVEHGVDGTLRRNFDLAGKTAEQFLPDLPRPPMRSLLLQVQDSRLDLHRQLLAVAVRPPCTVGDPLQPTLLVTIKDLVTRFPGNIELPAQQGHRFTLDHSGN